MIWELVFLAVFIGGMWSSWRGGYRNGMEVGVMTTLRNLEIGDIIKVKNNSDGSTVIKALPKNEMHIDPFGRTHTVKLIKHDK
jgi:hypothetical protein